MNDKDPISEAAAAAAKTHPPLKQVATQDLAALKRTQAAEFLAFDVRKAKAWFPEGLDSSSEKYSSQAEVSEFLKSKRISAVEFTNHNTIKFVFDDGVAVSLTPSGTEGDDLDLTIERPTST
jgi:phosphomannomutase